MLKLLTGVCLALLCGSVKSETIKLSCNYGSAITFPSGTQERSKGKILLEVETTGNRTFIHGDNGEHVIAIVSVPTGAIKEVDDLSDGGKWKISNTRHGDDGRKIYKQVAIDRNTGDFSYYTDYGGSGNLHLAGTCDKVNVSKRKF